MSAGPAAASLLELAIGDIGFGETDLEVGYLVGTPLPEFNAHDRDRTLGKNRVDPFERESLGHACRPMTDLAHLEDQIRSGTVRAFWNAHLHEMQILARTFRMMRRLSSQRDAESVLHLQNHSLVPIEPFFEADLLVIRQKLRPNGLDAAGVFPFLLYLLISCEMQGCGRACRHDRDDDH